MSYGKHNLHLCIWILKKWNPGYLFLRCFWDLGIIIGRECFNFYSINIWIRLCSESCYMDCNCSPSIDQIIIPNEPDLPAWRPCSRMCGIYSEVLRLFTLTAFIIKSWNLKVVQILYQNVVRAPIWWWKHKGVLIPNDLLYLDLHKFTYASWFLLRSYRSWNEMR